MTYLAGVIMGLWMVVTIFLWGIAEIIRGFILLIRRKEKR